MLNTVDIENSSRVLMENQLAAFFRGVAALRAHWFRVVKLDENDLQSDLMNSTFPSISKLLSIDEKVLIRLLVSLDFVRKKKELMVFFITSPE
mmetsp:Transcript_1535/g.2384  ORF Transcript_1535/g.2384 Transcript_1535/m.2384 type:complete len:93 (-) Transcript_1535:272-550(-)